MVSLVDEDDRGKWPSKKKNKKKKVRGGRRRLLRVREKKEFSF
jgi:hypothetical protein